MCKRLQETLTPAALQSIITAAIVTAMSQSPTNRALFVNDNASGGVNMSPSDIPDTSSSISTRISEVPRTHYETTSAPTIEEAQEKLRIDPTKHLRFDLHSLQNLITRLNTANQALVPPVNILCQIFEEILKDPREALKIDSNYCKRNNSTLNETMEYLIQPSGAQPIEKTIKIHELKTKCEKKYCLWFQNGSCRFGKACKKLHEIDPDYKKKIQEEKKEINNDKKRNPTKFQRKCLEYPQLALAWVKRRCFLLLIIPCNMFSPRCKCLDSGSYSFGSSLQSSILFAGFSPIIYSLLEYPIYCLK